MYFTPYRESFYNPVGKGVVVGLDYPSRRVFRPSPSRTYHDLIEHSYPFR